jgi:hypothetical protein
MIKTMTGFIDRNPKTSAMVGKLLVGLLLGPATTLIGKDVFDLIKHAGKGLDPGPAPQPLSFMKQLPASSWEKMGLVIGAGMGGSPASQTAHNTKSIAQDMKKLVSYVARGGGAGTFNLQNAP